MNFGANLKRIRKEKNIGLNQLALKSEVSSAQISRFENGKRKTPQIDTVEKLAKALEVSVNELLGIDASESKNELELREALKDIISFDGKPMDDEDREAIIAFMLGRKSNK